MPDVDPDLIALHNTSEKGIRAALRLGGIPVPSIGITKKNTAFTGYGDITLIADRSTIDPQLDPRNKVFSSDVYSPRQPRPHQPVKRGAGDKVYKKMQSLIPEGFTSWSEIATGEKAHELIVDKGPDNVAKTIDKLSRSSDVMAAFLSEQGVAVPRITQEPRLRNRLLSNETIKDPRLNVLRQHKDDLSSFINTPEGIAIGDIVRDIALDPYSSDPNMLERARRNLVSRVGEYGTELPFSEAAYLQSDLETVASAKKEIDRYAIKDWLTEQVANRKPEFDKWITNLVTDVFDPQQFIVSGKTKKPYTLENLVGQMTRKVLAQEGGMTYSLGKARASSASTLPTVEAMRSASGSLTDSSKMKEFKDSLSKEFSDIAETMSNYDVFSSVFDRMDRLSEAVGKIAKRPTSASSVLSRADFKDVPVDVVKRVQAFAEKLNKAPTEYFEAKPQRAVGINEFKAAVVPESTSPEVVNALKQSGLTVETYKGSEDRVATVERVSGERNLRFMPSDAEYLSAVEAGDTAKAQELVDQAAKAAGYSATRYYHGSTSGQKPGNVLDRRELFFLTESQDVAEKYANNKQVISVLIPQNQNVLSVSGPKDLLIRLPKELAKPHKDNEFSWEVLQDPNLPGLYEDSDVIGFLRDDLGYDGIRVKDDVAGGERHESLAWFRTENIKSADPITRDDAGNVIPLSQRFQQSSADIRYMPAPVPDPSIPGAYSMSGYRILPGKTKGKLRVYSPSGSLVGVVGSVDDAQRMIQKKLK